MFLRCFADKLLFCAASQSAGSLSKIVPGICFMAQRARQARGELVFVNEKCCGDFFKKYLPLPNNFGKNKKLPNTICSSGFRI
jgi:hypothetical protein